MSNIVNVNIIKDLEKNCAGNEQVCVFLKELLFEESEHASQWQWKEIYRKKIEKYGKDEE